MGRGVPALAACTTRQRSRTEGISDLFTQFPQVKAKVDAGYRSLAK